MCSTDWLTELMLEMPITVVSRSRKLLSVWLRPCPSRAGTVSIPAHTPMQTPSDGIQLIALERDGVGTSRDGLDDLMHFDIKKE